MTARIFSIPVVLAATGALADRKQSTASKILVLLAVIFLGAYGAYLTLFSRLIIGDSIFDSIGLISICWLYGLIASPIAGASVAVIPGVLLLRRGLGFIKTALIVTSFAFVLGLFLFKFEGAFRQTPELLLWLPAFIPPEIHAAPSMSRCWYMYTWQAPAENIQFIRVITRQSPSWVGWQEIEVLAP